MFSSLRKFAQNRKTTSFMSEMYKKNVAYNIFSAINVKDKYLK